MGIDQQLIAEMPQVNFGNCQLAGVVDWTHFRVSCVQCGCDGAFKSLNVF